jgi:hypothetical protein
LGFLGPFEANVGIGDGGGGVIASIGWLVDFILKKLLCVECLGFIFPPLVSLFRVYDKILGDGNRGNFGRRSRGFPNRDLGGFITVYE